MARGWVKEDVNVLEKSATATPAEIAAEARITERDRQRRLQLRCGHILLLCRIRSKGLQLQRERILSERTSSPHRRSALEAALIEIEEQLAQLGWAIHI